MSGTATAPLPRAFSLPIQAVPIPRLGLTAWLVEDHAIPVAALAWSWRGGAALDPAGREGAAALAAALLSEGAGDLPATAFGDALRDEAIGLSFSVDRDGFEGGLRALTEALPEAVRLARLALTAPRLDAEAVERVRARALAAVRRAQETPRGQAGRAFWATAFPGHPAGRETGGTEASLAALTQADFRAALDRQLRRGGEGAPFVTAAGALTPARLVEVVEELFADLPAGAPHALPPLPTFEVFGQRIIPLAAPQSAAVFGQDGLAPEDPEWEAAQVALRILAGGGFTSRLMQAVREKRGLAYGIGAGLSTLFGRAIIAGSVSTENARIAETLAVTREEWARMAADGPTAEELSDAVAFLTGSLPLQFTDSRRIADSLLAMRQNARPIDWLAGRPARLRALTRDRVAAIAARLLHPDRLSIMVSGQPVGL